MAGPRRFPIYAIASGWPARSYHRSFRGGAKRRTRNLDRVKWPLDSGFALSAPRNGKVISTKKPACAGLPRRVISQAQRWCRRWWRRGPKSTGCSLQAVWCVSCAQKKPPRT